MSDSAEGVEVNTSLTPAELSMHQMASIASGLNSAGAQLGPVIGNLAAAGVTDSREFKRLCEIRDELDAISVRLSPTILLEYDEPVAGAE